MMKLALRALALTAVLIVAVQSANPHSAMSVEGSEWRVHVSPRVKAFLDYYFAPQHKASLSFYTIPSASPIQEMARALVRDSSLNFFDRATVAYWSRNRELVQAIVQEVEDDGELRDSLSANWLWTVSMLAAEGTPSEYVDRAGREGWQELREKYRALAARKDPNWGVPHLTWLRSGFRDEFQAAIGHWQEEHQKSEEKPRSRDELLMLIPDEEVEVRLERLRACLAARDFRNLLPPPWHQRIADSDPEPEEMTRLRSTPPWRLGGLFTFATRDILDFLTNKLMARGDVEGLTDIARFIRKMDDMRAMDESAHLYARSMFSSFVGRFKGGCSDEAAVARLVEINDQLREMWKQAFAETEPLTTELAETLDPEKRDAIVAGIRESYSPYIAKQDAALGEAVRIVSSIEPSTLRQPPLKEYKRVPSKPAEWQKDWEQGWTMQLAPEVAEYVRQRIRGESYGGSVSQKDWQERTMKARDALAASESLADTLTAAWWAGRRPTTETALQVARRMALALDSDEPLSNEELVIAAAILGGSSFYRMSDPERDEVASVADRCLDEVIDSEPLWALPRLLKIILAEELITARTPTVWNGGNRGPRYWAQIPDTAVYDLLAQVRQASLARDFSIVLAPPWLERVDGVAEVPVPLSWGSLSDRALVIPQGGWMTGVIWMLRERLVRKKDWEGLADVLRWQASVLGFSPELLHASSYVQGGFEDIEYILKRERPRWLHLEEFKELVEAARKIEQDIHMSRGLPDAVKDLPYVERRAATEKWERGKCRAMQQVLLQAADLLAGEE